MSLHRRERRRPQGAGAWLCVWGAVLLAVLLFGTPLAVVFGHAFAKGFGAWWAVVSLPETMSAVGLTVLTLVVCVPLSAVFGLSAAWVLTKFRWKGKTLLVSIIELPFSVSPIVAGVACLLVYGASGPIGAILMDYDIPVMFAVPGIILAILFVVSPFIARELLPLMRLHGTDDEEAAIILGAGGLKTFLRVTLPNIRWALLYGVILCAARVLGEFGAVSVVSGHIRGETNTLPLYIDLLFHDYDNTGSFAVASVLTLMAVVTLAAKAVIERQIQASQRSAHQTQ